MVFFYEDEPEKYPEYDNYDAIEVSKVADIPSDYQGLMGVPITFIDKYCPEQFEFIGSDYQVRNGEIKGIIKENWGGKIDRGYINGKRMYSRVLIKNKHPRTKKVVLGL